MPIDGSRTEGDGLELGVFTQDLAQDLVRCSSLYFFVSISAVIVDQVIVMIVYAYIIRK